MSKRGGQLRLAVADANRLLEEPRARVQALQKAVADQRHEHGHAAKESQELALEKLRRIDLQLKRKATLEAMCEQTAEWIQERKERFCYRQSERSSG